MSLATITARDPLAAFCIGKTLPLEGKYVDDVQDPGGATNYGISVRWAAAEVANNPAEERWLDIDRDGHVDGTDIREMTADQAAEAYFQLIWTPGWYQKLAPPMVCWKAFDIGVNAGPLRSGFILQYALCDVGPAVAVDVDIGPATVQAVKIQAQKDGAAALLKAMRVRQAKFYHQLAGKRPELGKYLKGWLARAAL